MSQGRKVDMTSPLPSVESAIREHDWVAARYAKALKLARLFDATDGGREGKSLALSLDVSIAQCEADDSDASSDANTPLADIMRMAADG